MSYWTIHSNIKCLRSSCEKMVVLDHCLGHKSCEHQTLWAWFGIKMIVVRQSFHCMQPTQGRVFCCNIRGHLRSKYPRL